MAWALEPRSSHRRPLKVAASTWRLRRRWEGAAPTFPESTSQRLVPNRVVTNCSCVHAVRTCVGSTDPAGVEGEARGVFLRLPESQSSGTALPPQQSMSSRDLMSAAFGPRGPENALIPEDIAEAEHSEHDSKVRQSRSSSNLWVPFPPTRFSCLLTQKSPGRNCVLAVPERARNKAWVR